MHGAFSDTITWSWPAGYVQKKSGLIVRWGGNILLDNRGSRFMAIMTLENIVDDITLDSCPENPNAQLVVGMRGVLHSSE
jgi:hypothetical protein